MEHPSTCYGEYLLCVSASSIPTFLSVVYTNTLIKQRGPGKLKRKKKKAPRKRKRCFGDENADDDDEDYNPKGGRGNGKKK